MTKKFFWGLSTPLKPGPGGLDPSLIYHSKAHKLLYIPNISDLPDGQLTCLPFVTYSGIKEPIRSHCVELRTDKTGR